jgi:hypothetical protein
MFVFADTVVGWKAWASENAQTWFEIAAPGSGIRRAGNTSVAMNGDRVVLFDDETGSTSHTNTLWVGRLTPIQ